MPLSRDSVLDAALDVVRAEGIRALTMRRLAAELHTGAASLYAYFPNRDALLREAFDRVVGTVVLEEPDPERWRKQTIDLLTRYREVMQAYPGIAAVAIAELPLGLNSARVCGVCPMFCVWCGVIVTAV